MEVPNVVFAILVLGTAYGLAQSSGRWEGALSIGSATPVGAWRDQSQGSVQLGIGGRYHLSGIALGAEVVLAQGHSKRQFSSAEDGNISTAALIPQVFLPIFSGSHWQFHGLAGYGVARVSAGSGYRTDLVPTANGPILDSHGGVTTWHTTRPMGMGGLGLTRSYKPGKRLGLEVRWQQVATPGTRATTLSACLMATW